MKSLSIMTMMFLVTLSALGYDDSTTESYDLLVSSERFKETKSCEGPGYCSGPGYNPITGKYDSFTTYRYNCPGMKYRINKELIYETEDGSQYTQIKKGTWSRCFN